MHPDLNGNLQFSNPTKVVKLIEIALRNSGMRMFVDYSNAVQCIVTIWS